MDFYRYPQLRGHIEGNRLRGKPKNRWLAGIAKFELRLRADLSTAPWLLNACHDELAVIKYRAYLIKELACCMCLVDETGLFI